MFVVTLWQLWFLLIFLCAVSVSVRGPCGHCGILCLNPCNVFLSPNRSENLQQRVDTLDPVCLIIRIETSYPLDKRNQNPRKGNSSFQHSSSASRSFACVWKRERGRQRESISRTGHVTWGDFKSETSLRSGLVFLCRWPKPSGLTEKGTWCLQAEEEPHFGAKSSFSCS